MNRSEIEEMLRLHRDFNNREDIRMLKEIHNSNRNIAKNILERELLDSYRNSSRSIIENQLLQRNTRLDSINYLQDITDQKNHRLRAIRETSSLQTFSAIEEIKRRDLFPKLTDIEAYRLKAFSDEYIPKWQKELTSALTIKRDEIDNIFNQRDLIREIKNRSDIFSSNFLDRNYWNEVEKVRDTFIGDLTSSMRDAIFNSKNELEAIQRFENLVEEKFESLPESGFTRVELITIILAVLGLILTTYQSVLSTYQFVDAQKSSQEQSQKLSQEQKENTDRIVNFLERIANNTEIADEEYIYYVVKRDVSVKKQTSHKSATLDYLSANTKVRLLKTNHEWIFIEYMDYLELVPRYGWVNKKYLKRLEK